MMMKGAFFFFKTLFWDIRTMKIMVLHHWFLILAYMERGLRRIGNSEQLNSVSILKTALSDCRNYSTKERKILHKHEKSVQ
jgi:hypothetical protein